MRNWLRRWFLGQDRRSSSRPYRPTAEALEDRFLPAPVITGVPISAIEGSAENNVTVATFTDSNSDVSSYQATIDWGDGTAATAGTLTGSPIQRTTVAGSHTYAEAGTYVVTITVSFFELSSSATTSATVFDAGIDAGILPITAVATVPINNAPVAALADANPQGSVSDFTATISWGDNTSSAGTVTGPDRSGMFLVSGSHTYNVQGHFSIGVNIKDEDGMEVDLEVGNDAVVQPLPSTTTLTATPGSTIVFGQAAVFTARVSGGGSGGLTPTGTVTFNDGTTPLGTRTLDSSGTATFTTAALTTGTHTITAVYGGDGVFSGSTGSLAQTVAQASTSVTLRASANPSVFGQSVTFTATIGVTAPGAGTPTGTVQFQIDGSDAGNPVTVRTSGGVTTASFSTTMLAAGTHTVTAKYSGDTNFTVSATALSQTVNKANTSATLASSANPSVFGQSVTFTLTIGVTPPGAGTPTGTVQFQIDGSNVIGPTTVTTTAGVTTASLSDAILTVGTHTISASYSGDANFTASTAGPLTQVVNPANTVTTLSSSVNPSIFSLPVTFTAVVKPMPPGNGTPTGFVTFQDGTHQLGSAALDRSGIATFTTTALVAGMHSVTVVYNGDSNFNKSTSAAIIQTVTVTPNQAYIAALYQAVLQRSPDTGGLNFWVQQLQAGMPRSTIAQAFELSVEHRVIEVNQLYLSFFHRSADDAGRAVWLNALVSGQSEAAVAVAFLTSPEYTAAHPDNASYVGALYQDVLIRSSNPAEAAYWIDLLQRGVENRAQVGLSFLGSPEAFQIAIQYYYKNKDYLNRLPAPAETQAYLDALQRGRLTPTSLATTFLASDEFLADAIQRAGG